MQTEADEGIKVLAVSINRQNLSLLGQVLEEAGYRVKPVAGLEEFDRVAIDSGKFDLALVDITGFDRSIWSRCERLQEADVPLLLVGARGGASLAQAGENVGAASVLVKPLAVKELLGVIRYLVRE